MTVAFEVELDADKYATFQLMTEEQELEPKEVFVDHFEEYIKDLREEMEG
jgi:hypothetical protein